MTEYKQYAPANHFHMTWDLPGARLQHWMNLTNVMSVTPGPRDPNSSKTLTEANKVLSTADKARERRPGTLDLEFLFTSRTS